MLPSSDQIVVKVPMSRHDADVRHFDNPIKKQPHARAATGEDFRYSAAYPEASIPSSPAPASKGASSKAPHIFKKDPFFGRHDAIQTAQPGLIKINHAAALRKGCCGCADRANTRKYFWVLENGIETNIPIGARCCPCLSATCWPFKHFVCPPNCCCPGEDEIYKFYFDRSIFDRQTCCFRLGCLNGEAEVFPGELHYVCCCFTVPVCCAKCFSCVCDCNCLVYCKPWGNKVRFLPYHRYCCCCPARACWAHNCCSLCGPKSGEPLPWALEPVVDRLLDEDEAHLLADEINVSRSEWGKAHGKNLSFSYN